jgi:hypothetical protein
MNDNKFMNNHQPNKFQDSVRQITDHRYLTVTEALTDAEAPINSNPAEAVSVIDFFHASVSVTLFESVVVVPTV